jgi:hypothetical protein
MTERDQARDAERLPEEAARRVLERASELEAGRSAELSVAELREAAREAGIAPVAFEQALAEYRAADPASLVEAAPSPGRRLARFWPAALGLAVLVSVLVIRLLFPAP